MLSDSKIAYLSAYCLVWFMNIRVEDVILPITVRQIET